MSLPATIASYEDCENLFASALEHPRGQRACFATEREARMFQMRMHTFRSLHRGESRRMYTPADPQYDKSEFDRLVVRVRGPDDDFNWWVYVERHGMAIITIEEL